MNSHSHRDVAEHITNTCEMLLRKGFRKISIADICAGAGTAEIVTCSFNDYLMAECHGNGTDDSAPQANVYQQRVSNYERVLAKQLHV